MAYTLTKCFKCGKVIRGQSREMGKRMFHFDCLTCANCKSVLGADDNGKIRDNRIYCKPCYTKRFRPRCDKCRQAIAEGEGLTSQGKTIHELCFRCAGCQRPMGPGEQVMIKDEVYCRQQCYTDRLARQKSAAAALANAAQVTTPVLEPHAQAEPPPQVVESEPTPATPDECQPAPEETPEGQAA